MTSSPTDNSSAVVVPLRNREDQLGWFDRAYSLLQKCASIDEIKDIRDKALAEREPFNGRTEDVGWGQICSWLIFVVLSMTRGSEMSQKQTLSLHRCTYSCCGFRA
jgi:hypothetical protein